MKLVDVSPEQNVRFMDALEPYAVDEMNRHNIEKLTRRTGMPLAEAVELPTEELDIQLAEAGYGWSYHDILTRDVMAELGAGKPLRAEPAVEKVFVGNLLVENGHAEYDRVTAQAFEANPVFRKWKNLWVSEEYYHGPSMQEWAKAVGYIDIDAVHVATQGYLRHGLTLKFPTTAHGLAYPALQEPATRITHMEVMKTLPKSGESLAAQTGRAVLGGVIADERAHEMFYTRMVYHALETDDVEIVSQQMLAVADATMGFAMPGMESDIPGREEITRAYNETGVFTIGKLALDVLLPAIDGKGAYGWDIANRTALTDEAKQAQADLIDFTDKLKQAGGRDRRLLLVLGRARQQYGQVA